jgi:ABC-2 type transport system permease protein
MQSHLLLLAELRWNLFRNSLRLPGGRYEVLARIVVTALASVVALTFGALFAGGGYVAFARGRPQLLGVMLWAVLLAWQLLPLLLEATTHGVNFRQIARYPITFRLYCLLDTAYGLLDTMAMLGMFCLACLWGGAVVAKPEVGWRLAALLAAFTAANLLFSRVLFAFLERLLSTRRGRELFMLATLLLMFAPYAFFAVARPSDLGPRRDSPAALERAQGRRPPRQQEADWRLRVRARAVAADSVSPAGLVRDAAFARRFSETLPAWLGLSAWLATAALILRRQLLLRYRGEVFSESPVIRTAVQVEPGWRLTTQEALSAVLEKELRYTWREPVMLMNFLGTPLMAAFFALSTPFQQVMRTGLRIDADQVYPGLAAFSILSVGSRVYNQFCHDSYGFQRWCLAPVAMRVVVVGKNLVSAATVLANFLLVTALISTGHAIPPAKLAQTALAFAFALVVTTAAGNLFSVHAPVAIEYASTRSRNVSGVAILGIVAIQFLIGALVFLAFWLERWQWLGLAGLLAAAIIAYRWSLDYAARYAETHSEVIAGKLLLR